jgi:hypothetical protein
MMLVLTLQFSRGRRCAARRVTSELGDDVAHGTHPRTGPKEKGPGAGRASGENRLAATERRDEGDSLKTE